ncbi:hypothetical protein K0M31_004065 [Melipona bicolor]|uniref:Uncharacterized protein n=1 Tax=Melipona bicolor TaxID=60889 RepID=A0AA40FY42_9HYME|nr:hypothetical protein K0M31_004065 [Melipona bicolor]
MACSLARPVAAMLPNTTSDDAANAAIIVDQTCEADWCSNGAAVSTGPADNFFRVIVDVQPYRLSPGSSSGAIVNLVWPFHWPRLGIPPDSNVAFRIRALSDRRCVRRYLCFLTSNRRCAQSFFLYERFHGVAEFPGINGPCVEMDMICTTESAIKRDRFGLALTD